MKKKIFIFCGEILMALLLVAIVVTLCCTTASASTITQNTYYSDDIYFPDAQYEMNFDFKLGAAASTSDDYNKVIYNDVLTRDIADAVSLGNDNYTFKYVNYQQSQDIFENIDLVTYYSYFEGFLSGDFTKTYGISVTDSTLINNDLYFRISDFFYKPSDYKGHSLIWKNATTYYNALLEEDFDVNDDLGFYDYTYFTNENGVIVPHRVTGGFSSNELVASYSNGNISIDGFIIEMLADIDNLVAFYLHDMVFKFKDLFYYYNTSEGLRFEVKYYHYDNDMFTRLGNFQLNTEDIDMGDFLKGTVGSFMDFEIAPGFSFGILLSFILTLALLVWIIKVFMGG